MGWFDDVPDEVEIAGNRFWMAQEALEDQADPGTYGDAEFGDRPETDWAATSLLLLARLQLDQFVEILRMEFDIEAGAFSGREVARRLGVAVGLVDGADDQDDLASNVDTLGDGVDLWRALHAYDGHPISHAFEWDGSITLTTGPDLPQLAALGVRASDGGELNTSPQSVFSSASFLTHTAAELAAVRRRRERSAESPGAPAPQSAEAHPEPDMSRARNELATAAHPHFSIWWLASEPALVDWLIGFLDNSGLLQFDTEIDRARSAARLVGLWAAHHEVAGYSGEGTPGDWRYSVTSWIDAGITREQLHLLSEEVGLPEDDDEGEMLMDERCSAVVEHFFRDVADALLKELGYAYTFAHFWASRFENTSYPLAPELVGEIVNDSSVYEGDPENKVPSYDWVQSGMFL